MRPPVEQAGCIGRDGGHTGLGNGSRHGSAAGQQDGGVRRRRIVFVDTNALATLLLGLCFGQVSEPAPPALLRYADACRTRYLHHFVCADDIHYEEESGVRENAAWRTRIQQRVLEDLGARDADAGHLSLISYCWP